jgi:hypothetical protein
MIGRNATADAFADRYTPEVTGSAWNSPGTGRGACVVQPANQLLVLPGLLIADQESGSGDDPDVDDVYRRRLIINFVQDADVTRVQPVDARATPGDHARRIRLISQQRDGSTRPDEQVLILAANAS